MSNEREGAEPREPQTADPKHQEIEDLEVSESQSESVVGGGSAGDQSRRTG
jgi:hypothetical protein